MSKNNKILCHFMPKINTLFSKLKSDRMRGRVFYTVLMLLALLITMSGIIGYMFNYSEAEAEARLRLETAKFKTNINIQVNSDMETLRSMASLLSRNYNTEADYLHICKDFEAFGFCENIGILLPDNRLITKHGALNVSNEISFADEAHLGEYVSGRVKDLTNNQHEVIRFTVPITSPQGNTVAVMYGTIDIKHLTARYKSQAETIDAYLCIIDGKNGDFLIDTKNTTAKHISSLSHIKFKEGFDYNTMAYNLRYGNPGYTAFVAHDKDEFLYVRYDKLNIGDWRIMMAQPESVVFSGTRASVRFLLLTSLLILLIMLAYVLCILYQISRMLRMNSYAADIRKSLLEMNQRNESLEDALKTLSHFAASRSAFIIDTSEDMRYYISPDHTDDRLLDNDVEYFNKMLLLYTSRHRSVHGARVYVSQIKCDAVLLEEMPDFCKFLKQHHIQRIKYGVVINSDENIYLLGVANPKRRGVSELLSKISVCFSMAVYSKAHLADTEHMALTDPLTGIANRMAFNQNIKSLSRSNARLACVYVDVNELHFFNNKYGHTAGDHMLIYIVSCLIRNFADSQIYRMGGDEFLIITKNLDLDNINKRINEAVKEIEDMQYHVAVGIAEAKTDDTIWDMVNKAEKLMAETKNLYYQNRELSKVKAISSGSDVISIKTGINELDACISVMNLKYMGVFCVSFEKDKCTKILASEFFSKIIDESKLFSTSIQRYFHEMVKPEYHRALLSLLNYDVLSKSLSEGAVPCIKYKRIDGKKVILKIYSVTQDGTDSVWVFERAD